MYLPSKLVGSNYTRETEEKYLLLNVACENTKKPEKKMYMYIVTM